MSLSTTAIVVSPPQQSSLKTSPTPKYASFVKAITAIKEAGHAWQVGGTFQFKNLKIELEGTVSIDFKKRFQDSLRDFAASYPKMINNEELNFLCSLLKEREITRSQEELQNYLRSLQEGRISDQFVQSSDLLYDDFLKGEPISISSGFLGHRVIVSIGKDYLMIANKGAAVRKPIEVYKIDPQTITKAHLQEIIDLRLKPKKEYQQWLKAISEKFKTSKDAVSLCIEQAYPISNYQEVGNCVWESLQTCVYGMFLLHRLKESKNPFESRIDIEKTNQTFLFWREFLQLQSLEKIFRECNNYPNLLSSLNEKNENQQITFEKIDTTFLRNVFRQYWYTLLPSSHFKNTMDKLESLYFRTMSGPALHYAKAEKFYYNQISRFPYVVKDLTKVWMPSVAVTTALAASAYFWPPARNTEFLCRILAPLYSFSLFHTYHIARRHFAI